MNYYDKYIKYRLKYFDMLQHGGGGITNAKKIFDTFIASGDKTNFLKMLNDNIETRTHLAGGLEPVELSIENIGVYKDKIFCLVIANLSNVVSPEKIGVPVSEQDCQKILSRDKPFKIPKSDIFINWFIKKYINCEIPRLSDTVSIVTTIDLYDKVFAGRDYSKLSYAEINEFIRTNDEQVQTYLEKQKKKDAIKKNKTSALVLETPGLKIYNPSTIEESKYYGAGTRWCTAEDDNNKFTFYNSIGPLYIIIPKKPIRSGEKYQFHKERKEFMDEANEGDVIDLMLRFSDDSQFIKWCIDKDIIKSMERYFIRDDTDPRYTDLLNHTISSIDIYKELASLDTFNKIQKIEMYESFNSPIVIFPESLKIFELGTSFNQPIDNLPDTVEVLELGKSFNQPISKLPGNLKTLIMSDTYNQPINNLPDGIKVLIMGKSFNYPLNLPESLEELEIGSSYNHQINKLPELLKKIKYMNSFNSSIDGFPDSLTHLYLNGDYFNLPINKLPVNLTVLSVGDRFNHPINIFSLYPLEELYLGNSFNQSVENLPATLKKLGLGNAFNQSVENLPATLKKLTLGNAFNQSINNLPKELIELTLGNAFNQPVDNLPKELIELTLGNAFNQPIHNLLKELIELTLGNAFNQPVDNLPERLSKLTLGDAFNQPVNNLPNRLMELALGNAFNQPIENLPKYMRSLILGNAFNQPIDNLSEFLLNLHIYGIFNQQIDKLPKHLSELHIGYVFDKSVNTLPKMLFELEIESKYFEKSFENLPEHTYRVRIKHKKGVKINVPEKRDRIIKMEEYD